MLERWRDVWCRFGGEGTYPHELSALLLIPLRRVVLSPEQLVEQLQLTPSSRVLEVGPGPGYFSRAVARAVPYTLSGGTDAKAWAACTTNCRRSSDGVARWNDAF